jgi:hypothetical protein
VQIQTIITQLIQHICPTNKGLIQFSETQCDIKVHNGYFLAVNKLIAIKAKCSHGVTTSFIPFDVAKIISNETCYPMDVSVSDNKVTLNARENGLRISYEDSKKDIYDPFEEKAMFNVELVNSDVVKILSDLNKVKKFNARVLAGKTPPPTDLRINFRKGWIEFVNLKTKVKKSLACKCNQEFSTVTYGGLLIKILRGLSTEKLDLCPKAQRTINK